MSTTKKRSLPSEDSTDPPMKKRRHDVNQFSTWHLFCNEKKWDITVYKQTSLSEIKENMRDITGIQQLRCKDQNGLILFLSSNLPDNINIFVDDLAKQQQSSHGHKSNVSKDSNCATNSSRSKIALKIVLLGDEDPLRIKVKPTTLWNKIFESFGNYKGREPKYCRFIFDGRRIFPRTRTIDPQKYCVKDFFTAEDLAEEEELQINVLFEQAGS